MGRSRRTRQRDAGPPSYWRNAGLVAIIVALISALGAVVAARIQRDDDKSSYSPTTTASPPKPTAQAILPPGSIRIYDVPSGDKSVPHRMGLGGWVEQYIPTRPDYEITEIAAIPGVGPAVTDPASVGPLLFELLENGNVRAHLEVPFRSDVDNIARLPQPVKMFVGAKYSLKVTNTSGKEVSYYVKPAHAVGHDYRTIFHGSLDTKEGLFPKWELSGHVIANPA
jgi:hypothetical protein